MKTKEEFFVYLNQEIQRIEWLSEDDFWDINHLWVFISPVELIIYRDEWKTWVPKNNFTINIWKLQRSYYASVTYSSSTSYSSSLPCLHRNNKNISPRSVRRYKNLTDILIACQWYMREALEFKDFPYDWLNNIRWTIDIVSDKQVRLF